MTVQVQYEAEDWERIAASWSAWWAGELERPIIMLQRYEAPPEGTLPAVHDFISNYPLDMPAEEVIGLVQNRYRYVRYYGDDWPKWWPNFGPGIMGGFLGAAVNSEEDTVWFSPANDLPIPERRLAYDAHNPWLKRVYELTRVAAAQWGDRVLVGLTDLGGNLDILAGLHGTQRLLYELIDHPAEVERLVGEITRLWLRYYAELYDFIGRQGRGTSPWASIWSPGRCYMLQCDFSYMISPQMFERFVLPDITACCAVLDHSLYHMDGIGQIPHLDLLLSVERLGGIQWIPGEGRPAPEEWLPLLKRIIDAGKRCQLHVSPEGARTILRELGGRGFALRVDGSGLSHEDAQDLVRRLTTEYVA